jgi:hypothetical protein
VDLAGERLPQREAPVFTFAVVQPGDTEITTVALPAARGEVQGLVRSLLASLAGGSVVVAIEGLPSQAEVQREVAAAMAV